MSAYFSFSRFSSCYFCLLLVTALFHLCLSNTNSSPMLCMDDERQALLLFKHGLIDGADRLASWVREENSDCCKWAGIVCDNITGHVHKIHLPCDCRIPDPLFNAMKTLEECSKQKLRGNLSPSLLNLKQLMHLDLSHNDFGGKQIPGFLGSLKNLRYLNLSRSRFGGAIPPQLGNLSELRILSLGSFYRSNFYELEESSDYISSSTNNMQWLSGLRFLHHLDMSGLNLSKAIDWLQGYAHFTNLNRLKYLKGTGNKLILRPRLADWHPRFWLEVLYLSDWDIGPQFPSWLLQQSDLWLLDVRNTNISSTMSLSFWKLFPNLRYLDLSRNHIQGRLLAIPRNLVVLDLSYNKFSGQLPELLNSSSAYALDLSYNSFVGMLHRLICPYGGKALKLLNLANNHLSGAIPNQCWEKYTSLRFLNLENNNLSGEIPRTMGSLSSLGSLNMCNNKLSGKLPTSLKNLKELSVLQLAKNKFVGRIPTWLGIELSTLRILNLRSNNFHRNISHELCYLTRIQILDLARNNLSGNIPRCFNNYTILSGKETISPYESDSYIFGGYEDIDVRSSASLVIKGREDIYSTILQLVMIVDLSSNNLSGGIPSELTALQALRSLNLSNNQLTGSIPKKIGDMKSLESFDVSLNGLSGELPLSLSSLNFLSSFNVSYNSFTGRVPTSTQLQSFDESSFLGNKLCGDPLIKSCAVAVPGGDHEEKDGSHGADWGLIISAVSGFIVGFWVVLVPLIVSTTWRITYFAFLRELRYMVCDVIRKYWCNIFRK
ncbi:putative leucine-rich repeat-containing, plant-type, leucine-rich repeat domain superfamily [Helianthus annuus]|nr:putative leucine-rich repeat-containing, plant-type, leucine-rich repeat domain superfamily [Helianthus annuus]KAJ0856033.1 putative leucine-rich repeat-containing, plant-type, leucine-rich repeat domain superfamily [Helianthus annuus]